MPRIRKETILLEPYNLRYEEIREVLRIFEKQGYEYIILTTKPGYGLIKINNTTVLQAIAPNTIVLEKEKILKHLVEKIPHMKHFVLAKDTWLDTREVLVKDLLKIINLLDSLDEEIEINKYVIRTRKLETSIDDYIILDYINTPLYWLVPRKPYLDALYKKAVEKMINEKKKGRIVLGYIVSNNEYIPYLVLTSRNNQKTIEAVLVEGDELLRRIIFWSLIDILV
ncbi:MAG: hypothetical protein DRO16_01290 [Thermoprotei archaeon]|nr:MAG: hypothetical protein DRO16_01290 [Thermoprotei archaeon]